jgi:hypothetical protein
VSTDGLERLADAFHATVADFFSIADSFMSLKIPTLRAPAGIP